MFLIKGHIGDLLALIFTMLTVPVDIYKHTVNSSVPWGSRFDADCLARGDPLPAVRWLLDGKEVRNLSLCLFFLNARVP